MTIDNRTPDQRGASEAGEILHTHPEYQYLNLLKKLMDHGVEQVDKGTGVKTYSLFGGEAGTFVFDLTEGFPLLTTKRVYWKGVTHELYWFMSGQSNIKYLVDNDVHIWDDYPYKIYREKFGNIMPLMTKEEFIENIKTDEEFAKNYGELPHIYGEQWRRWPAKDGRKIDQVGWVLQEMREDPDAHNLIVNSWNPEYLYGMAKPEEACRFPICHNMFQVNVKDGRVNLQLYQRSADIFLGVPFNIASYALLTHFFAALTGNKPGIFTHVFGDIHIYENHMDAVKEQLARAPRDFPRVTIGKEVNSLENCFPAYVNLDGYNPHPAIKAELTPAGGYRKKFNK